MPAFDNSTCIGLAETCLTIRAKDTNGAVAGAMPGALHGDSGIPEKWLSCINEREHTIRLATMLRMEAESED